MADDDVWKHRNMFLKFKSRVFEFLTKLDTNALYVKKYT